MQRTATVQVNRDRSIHFENQYTFQKKRATRMLSFSVYYYWQKKDYFDFLSVGY